MGHVRAYDGQKPPKSLENAKIGKIAKNWFFELDPIDMERLSETFIGTNTR